MVYLPYITLLVQFSTAGVGGAIKISRINERVEVIKRGENCLPVLQLGGVVASYMTLLPPHSTSVDVSALEYKPGLFRMS